MNKNVDKWIQDAINHPNTFRQYCKRKGLLTMDGKVSKKCIQRGCKSKNRTTKRRACLAKTLKKLSKRRRK